MMVKIKLHPLVSLRQPSLPAHFNFEGKDILSAFQDHRLKEMLYTSSYSLFKEYQRWEENRLNQKQIIKLINSLYKYSLRMRFRSTPFGLLSEVCTIEKDKVNRGIYRRSVRRVSRLDSRIIQQLILKVENLKGISSFLKFQSNNTLYQSNDELRYFCIDYSRLDNLNTINKVKSDPVLNEVIRYCKTPRSGRKIKTLLNRFSENQSDKERYFDSLIKMQLIQSNLKISLSERDQLSRIIEIIQKIKTTKQFKSEELNTLFGNIVRLKLRLIRIDKGRKKRVSAYKALRRQLINMGIEILNDSFIQITQYSDMEVRKDEEAVKLPEEDELNQLINFLALFSRSNTNHRLEEFKDRFKRRYGDSKPPILEVMDPEIGLGYANNESDLIGNSPMIDILTPAKRSINDKQSQFPLFFQERLSDALRKGERAIEIENASYGKTDKEFKLPLSFSGVIKMVELSEDEDAILVKDIGGHHATHYLGRFIVDSTEAASLAKEIAKHEENCVNHAKLIQCYHAYNSKATNISNRPALYGSSLHILDNQSNRKTNLNCESIHVQTDSDGISLIDNVECSSLIPRISTAVDFRINTLPIHNFLGDLQSQDRLNDLNFYWGDWEKHFKHLPRVCFGRFIIQPEQWVLNSKEIKKHIDDTSFKFWQEQNQIPNKCLFIEGDQELLLNFEFPEAINLFESLIEKRPKIVLHEYFKPKEGISQDAEGNQLEHEIILSLLNEEEKKKESLIPTKHKTVHNLNSSSVDSEVNQWLYFKVYSNSLRTEKILEKLYPTIHKFKRMKSIEKWFFIRYADPDCHLRLRFKSSYKTNQNHLLINLKAKLEQLQSEGLVWKYVLDQYQPEYNRYGKKSMPLCEDLFHWESEAILRFLNSFKGNKRELFRWQMAILLVQDWFELFKLSHNERTLFIEKWCEAFKKESEFKKASKQNLAKQWRSKRAFMDQLIKKGNLRDLETKLLSGIVAEKSLKSHPFSDAILHLGDINRIEVSKINLLNSLCHMTCNRLFTHGPRANEFVIYDLMWNYYRSELARKKFKNKL